MDGKYIKIENVRSIFNRRFKVNATEFNLTIKDEVFEHDQISESDDESNYSLMSVDYLSSISDAADTQTVLDSNNEDDDNNSITTIGSNEDSDNNSEISFGNVSVDNNEDGIFRKYLKCFDEMLEFVRIELMTRPRDYIGVKIQIPSMGDIVPIGRRYVEVRELSSKMIVDLLLRVQQSNSVFNRHDIIEVTVSVIQNPTGGTVHPLSKISFNNYNILMKHKKRSILEYLNDRSFDDLKCLPRALILGKYWIECGKNRKIFEKFYRNKTIVQKKPAN